MTVLDEATSQDANVPYHEVPPEIDAREFVKVVESRRSVRRFTNEQIPPEIMRECLRLAHLAPSSSNLHQWEFYWVRTPELRAKLNEDCLGQGAARTAAELVVCVARTKTWKQNGADVLEQMSLKGPVNKPTEQYYKRLIHFVYGTGVLGWKVPVKWLVMNVTGLFRPMVRGPIGTGDVVTWAVKSAALACENLMLALRAFGFDSCPMEGFDESRIKKHLNLPCDAQVVMVVGAGRRDVGGVFGERVRLDEGKFIFER